MFRTSQHAEIPTGAIYGDDIRLWAFVEHSLHTPWFYVTVAEFQLGQALQTMLLVQDICALEALLANQNAVWKVVQVQLVSPGHMNKHDRWLMEPLLELIQISCQGVRRYEYCVEGGKWYTDQMAEAVSGDEHDSRRIIFQRT